MENKLNIILIESNSKIAEFTKYLKDSISEVHTLEFSYHLESKLVDRIDYLEKIIYLKCPENNLTIKEQISVISYLLKTFPNNKFVIVTNSPFIIGTCKNDITSIYRFTDNLEEIHFMPFGQPSHSIINLFSIDSLFIDNVKERFDKLNNIIVSGDLSLAKVFIVENFNDIDENHYELKRLKMLIRTKEILSSENNSNIEFTKDDVV